jgi:hypothetical protein
MLVKILFWGAVLCGFIGANSHDGNLLFFGAAHLGTLTIGLSLLRREKRARSSAPAQPSASASSKAKSPKNS